ncbi:YbaK/EbsC family protein [Nocardiopsis ansamitocini]|uniref:YbaK/aminoacyl-tRNA synthetase-associated domain-containing protein n=1 Tax=Nocardiopsis ansamitocini TaxID=1670832 RepID=A0A9W6P3Z8_9ACTN|nr:YbaK/EbsC family protein [Nocardiopsis ansamitocini]GLU46671.1 hypothetical protein Nans01_10220 [Nocardiopsis ansamitocini]
MWGLDTRPAVERTDLLARPVAAAVAAWKHTTPVERLLVAAIDADLADTANFCAAYEVPVEASANCVVIAAKRGGEVRYAACVVLATTRADVNGTVRRHLEARKASFAPQDDTVQATGMEYGGITPLGLPADWPILVDAAAAAQPYVVVGSGLRRSKLAVPGAVLAELPGAQVIEGLARQV